MIEEVIKYIGTLIRTVGLMSDFLSGFSDKFPEFRRLSDPLSPKYLQEGTKVSKQELTNDYFLGDNCWQIQDINDSCMSSTCSPSKKEEYFIEPTYATGNEIDDKAYPELLRSKQETNLQRRTDYKAFKKVIDEINNRLKDDEYIGRAANRYNNRLYFVG